MHHEIGSGDGMLSLQIRSSFLATDLGSALKATRPEVVALARKLRRRKPKGGGVMGPLPPGVPKTDGASSSRS